jgi:hypothetical protein
MKDSSGEWEVVGRPYTTNGWKNAYVRVQRANQPGVTEEDVGSVREGQCEAGAGFMMKTSGLAV